MTQTFARLAVALAVALSGTTLLLAQNRPLPDPVPSPTWESCDEMHDDYVRRFESVPGFGMSRMWRPPMADRSGVLDDGRTKYAVESLELVGLLKTDTPAVYTPWAHGDRPAPGAFTSRALTNFEKSALESFRTGRGLAGALAGQDGTIRCMGALRAKASCLRCHQDRQTGDLLGAFTYWLKPMK